MFRTNGAHLFGSNLIVSFVLTHFGNEQLLIKPDTRLCLSSFAPICIRACFAGVLLPGTTWQCLQRLISVSATSLALW